MLPLLSDNPPQEKFSPMVSGGGGSHAVESNGTNRQVYGVFDDEVRVDIRGRCIIDPDGVMAAV
jgi:hypothetical protein